MLAAIRNRVDADANMSAVRQSLLVEGSNPTVFDGVAAKFRAHQAEEGYDRGHLFAAPDIVLNVATMENVVTEGSMQHLMDILNAMLTMSQQFGTKETARKMFSVNIELHAAKYKGIAIVLP